MRKPSPAMVVALLGVFLGLGGVGVAATGGNFILGQPNSAGNTTGLSSNVGGGPTLALTNSGGQPAAKFTTNAGVVPFSVSSKAKVASLNADWLDGRDSAAFLAADAVRRLGPVTMPGTFATSFKTLATVAGLEFELSCTADAGINIAGLWIRSKVAHAAYSDVATNYQGPLNYSSPDMTADKRETLGGTGSPGFGSVTGEALTADRHHVSFSLYVAQDIGTATNHSCIGGGTLIVS